MRNPFVTNGYAGPLSQIRSKSHTDLTENTDLETITMTITITGVAAMPPFLFLNVNFQKSTILFSLFMNMTERNNIACDNLSINYLLINKN